MPVVRCTCFFFSLSFLHFLQHCYLRVLQRWWCSLRPYSFMSAWHVRVCVCNMVKRHHIYYSASFGSSPPTRFERALTIMASTPPRIQCRHLVLTNKGANQHPSRRSGGERMPRAGGLLRRLFLRWQRCSCCLSDAELPPDSSFPALWQILVAPPLRENSFTKVVLQSVATAVHLRCSRRIFHINQT